MNLPPNITPLFFIASCLFGGLELRTFHSADGERSFEGRVVGIEAGVVSIERAADQRVFESAIVEFSPVDQTYIRSIHPGAFIERVTLRAETVATENQFFDKHSGDLQRSFFINTHTSELFDKIQIFDIRRHVIIPNYENFRMAGKIVRVEALTTAGQARTGILCFFLNGTSKQIEIADCQYRDVMLDLYTSDTYFVFDPVNAYYGYVACAINLDSGKIMAIRGTKANATRFVEAHLEKPQENTSKAP